MSGALNLLWWPSTRMVDRGLYPAEGMPADRIVERELHPAARATTGTLPVWIGWNASAHWLPTDLPRRAKVRRAHLRSTSLVSAEEEPRRSSRCRRADDTTSRYSYAGSGRPRCLESL